MKLIDQKSEDLIHGSDRRKFKIKRVNLAYLKIAMTSLLSFYLVLLKIALAIPYSCSKGMSQATHVQVRSIELMCANLSLDLNTT